jgi:hypothetical protein
MKKVIFFLAILVLSSWGIYQCKYYFSYWRDLQDKPWAYSGDKNAKLLVGKWKGDFTDPDGVKKNIEIVIPEPTSEEEREHDASRRSKRKRSRNNKQGFDGTSVVVSKLGSEQYEIYGSVGKEDFHQLHFNFRPEDETKRILPNFTLIEAKEGNWQDDELKLTLHFAYHRADGSSHWNSADPKHNKTSIITLKRNTALISN